MFIFFVFTCAVFVWFHPRCASGGMRGALTIRFAHDFALAARKNRVLLTRESEFLIKKRAFDFGYNIPFWCIFNLFKILTINKLRQIQKGRIPSINRTKIRIIKHLCKLLLSFFMFLRVFCRNGVYFVATWLWGIYIASFAECYTLLYIGVLERGDKKEAGKELCQCRHYSGYKGKCFLQ